MLTTVTSLLNVLTQSARMVAFANLAGEEMETIAQVRCLVLLTNN